MKSIGDQLPPEFARQIHRDRRKNEAAYWAARNQLLDQYRGQWIGFADGNVIASGTSPVTVFHAAEATGLHPFFICVGREEEPCRIRRATFPYDAGYPDESLPVINVEFRQASRSGTRATAGTAVAGMAGEQHGIVVQPTHHRWRIRLVRAFERSKIEGLWSYKPDPTGDP